MVAGALGALAKVLAAVKASDLAAACLVAVVLAVAAVAVLVAGKIIAASAFTFE